MTADPDSSPSKGELKRRAHRAQEIGRRLVELNADELSRFDLPEALRRAVAEYARVRGFNAQKRHLQYIGKLIRDVDQEALQASLDTIDGQSAAARHQFHAIERWRDALIADDDALTRFIDEHPAVDRQHLRHWIKAARQDGSEQQQKAAARALFRFLRAALDP